MRPLIIASAGIAVAFAASHVVAEYPTAATPQAARGNSPVADSQIGSRVPRQGDEIVVCGELFHTTAPVVLWTDPGGYDAYRVERRFAPLDQSSWRISNLEVKALSSPNRFNMRRAELTAEQLEAFRGGGWTLEALRERVDQFVLHYDACGTSQRCFEVLHDQRGLSVHFLLDLDGTIYQTLDVKERAWHATISNDRSIGIEIAQVGAFSPRNQRVLDRWYRSSRDGQVRIVLPDVLGDGGVRTPNFVARPVRELVSGSIHGKDLVQYDFTAEQYESLARLTATLCHIFPRIRCDFPRDADGSPLPRKLTEPEWQAFQGILGHYHIQANKVDPGPAFQWNRLIKRAQGLLATAVE